MPNYQKIVWIGLGVTALAILALGYFLFLAPRAEKRAQPLPMPPGSAKLQREAAPDTVAENDPTIVPLDLDLDRSDPAVRELITASEIPAIVKEWSREKEIVRSVVAAIDNIAQGLSPAAQLPFLTPADKFSTVGKSGKFYLDPRSYKRYDSMVNAFTAIPDKTWITWYKTLLPTLEKAFKELGYPGVTFAQRLQQAIEQLTQVPLIRDEIVLEKKILSFAFADSNLENLNPAQKHLLRLGPDNAVRIQKKLGALSAALNSSRKK